MGCVRRFVADHEILSVHASEANMMESMELTGFTCTSKLVLLVRTTDHQHLSFSCTFDYIYLQTVGTLIRGNGACTR